MSYRDAPRCQSSWDDDAQLCVDRPDPSRRSIESQSAVGIHPMAPPLVYVHHALRWTAAAKGENPLACRRRASMENSE